MSHFAVLVMGKNEDDLERLLAPYDENISVAQYVSMTKEKMAEEYREITKRKLAYARKRLEKMLKDEETPDMSEVKLQAGVAFAAVDELMDVCPYDDKCYDAYVKNYADEESLDEDGNLLSTYNPKSKWDWYDIGGRFSGEFFKDKEGNAVDEGYASELDLGMDKEKFDAAALWWDVNIAETVEGEERDPLFFGKQYYLDRYKNREIFATVRSLPIFRAVVTPDGEWYEKGEMGWFCATSETAEESLEWDLNFYERFIKEAIEKNYYLTVVDCHI